MINKIKNLEALSREKLRTIFGGEAPGFYAASATADCGDGHSVTCTGVLNCTATDYVGCSCDDGNDFKECIIT